MLYLEKVETFLVSFELDRLILVESVQAIIQKVKKSTDILTFRSGPPERSDQ